jgi:hypothetical protein
MAVGIRVAGARHVHSWAYPLGRLPSPEQGASREVHVSTLFFLQSPLDIQQLFRDACDLIGVEYRNNRWQTISIARRASVAILDEIVGPKR